MMGQYSEMWDSAQMDDARCTLLRAARQAEDMLVDALWALRHGSPNITDEFVDRTARSLRDALDKHDRIVAVAMEERVKHLRANGVDV